MSRTVPHRRRRDPDPEEAHAGGMERWLLTYSDMITLLLALFVVLFALASVNKAKLEQLSQSIHRSLDSGGISVGAGRTPAQLARSHPVATTVPNPTLAHLHPEESSLSALEAQVKASLAAHGLLGDVAVQAEADDFVVQLLADTLFYATDSATLTPVGEQVVDATGKVLASHPNVVAVRGYTDDTPVIGGPFYSNWQLSASRAVVVVLRLVHVDGVNPSQVVAEGYGDTHPVAPNDSPANRARNRRVDIVVYALGAPLP